jgi:hypothetical protein
MATIVSGTISYRKTRRAVQAARLYHGGRARRMFPATRPKRR